MEEGKEEKEKEFMQGLMGGGGDMRSRRGDGSKMMSVSKRMLEKGGQEG